MKPRNNPERLAWLVLASSFLACLTLAVVVPLGIRWYALHSQVPQQVMLEVQRAPLRVTLGGQGVPVAVAESGSEIPEKTTIATDQTSGQLLMAVPRSEGETVAHVQIYDNTELTLVSARSPRFAVSRIQNRVELQVNRGRVRIGVYPGDQRGTLVEVKTPYGTAILSEGSYEVKVTTTAMEIAVRSGHATVSDHDGSADESTLALGPEERALLEGGQPIGPLPGARNLVVDSEFRRPLDEEEGGWSSYSSQADPAQPAAQVAVVTFQGRRAVEFYRAGSNHAEVAISQPIGYDVRDFTFLQLHMVVRINSQDIAGFGGCGYLSSECPIIVTIKFKDIYGADREWIHGFYTGEAAPGWPLYPWTEPLPPATWRTYESGNLMEDLADTPPAEIQEITVYASGHSFHALATEIELLVQE